jgi:hypothetical protein
MEDRFLQCSIPMMDQSESNSEFTSPDNKIRKFNSRFRKWSIIVSYKEYSLCLS